MNDIDINIDFESLSKREKAIFQLGKTYGELKFIGSNRKIDNNFINSLKQQPVYKNFNENEMEFNADFIFFKNEILFIVDHYSKEKIDIRKIDLSMSILIVSEFKFSDDSKSSKNHSLNNGFVYNTIRAYNYYVWSELTHSFILLFQTNNAINYDLNLFTELVDKETGETEEGLFISMKQNFYDNVRFLNMHCNIFTGFNLSYKKERR